MRWSLSNCILHSPGQALKSEGGIFGSLAEAAKKFYLTKVRMKRGGVCVPMCVVPSAALVVLALVQFKGFDLNTCSACTLLFEGTAEASWSGGRGRGKV